MPGSGKSTIGYILADRMSTSFIDIDDLIEVQEGKPLQRILDEKGYEELRKREEEVLLSMFRQDTLAKTSGIVMVIATGGSAVYSTKGMLHFRKHARCIYLNVPLDQIKKRINNFSQRGIAAPQSYTIEQIYDERHALYMKYAHDILNVPGGEDPTNTLERVFALCRS